MLLLCSALGLLYPAVTHAQFLGLPIVSTLATAHCWVFSLCFSVVLSGWLLGVRVVTTAVLHLHVPSWSFGGCLNYCVAVDCVGVVLLVMARLCFSLLFWEGVKG